MLCLLSKILACVQVQGNSRILCVAEFAHNRCFSKDHRIGNLKYTHNFQPERFRSAYTELKEDGLAKRLKKRFSGLIADKTRINISGLLVYEKLADNINWKEFFDYFELPDTFQSWFLGIQLHVWMCMVVAISEKNGRIFRNSLVDAMWTDVEQRLGELKNEIPQSSERKKYLTEMTNQFQAALVSYDEGILSDDTVLAAAVWRSLFSFGYLDPRLLENAVLYIRKQVTHLDSLNTEEFIKHGCVTFLSVKNIVYDVTD